LTLSTQAQSKDIFSADGFLNVSAGLANQASAFEAKKLPDGINRNYSKEKFAIGNDSQIFLRAQKKLENGINYGAVAKVEFNFNSNHRKENPNLDQTFLFAESDFGKVEFGNNFAVNQKMKVGAARIARGAGGINGKYLEHINLSMPKNSLGNVRLPAFILLAQSPIGHGGGAKNFSEKFNRSNFRALKDTSFDGVEDATKLSYYSPRLEGLQLGVSYAPNAANSGFTANTALDSTTTRIENIFSLGANYMLDLDNLGLAFSATAEKGNVKNSKSPAGTPLNDLMAYDLGASASYFGFTLGFSYGSWLKSLQPKSGIYSCDYEPARPLGSQDCRDYSGKKYANPNYFTAGISYEFGPAAASITALQSNFQNNKYQAISLGLDYKLSRDFMPYFEVTKFAFSSNQPTASDLVNQGSLPASQRQLKDNLGYVFLTGILLSF
jgi:hypothetical protein